MNENLTKKELYDIITEKIIELGLDPFSDDYQINSIEIANKICTNLEIEYLDFKERKICGILHKGEHGTFMALNNKRSDKGRNFDCMHEVVHYVMHNNNDFYCNENSNNYFEWQANEGAAQFLVPYQIFIPKFVEIYYQLYKSYENHYDSKLITNLTVIHLSWMFNVGEKVIENRIKNLQSEIIQYCDTRSINNIKIVSLTKQGINRKYNKIDERRTL